MALGKLTEIQRQAVEWDQGPLMVLAGPGSGKTQVLTCRIARLLDSSRSRNFHVLALTFTNKAADEMKSRVAALVPGLEERANIGTFHSFCAQVLRLHGVHLGIKPNFTIYSTDEDRRALLQDAIRRALREGKQSSAEDVKYLGMIDRLKGRLIEPAASQDVIARFDDRDRISSTYRLYENELRGLNALDFNSLIFEVHRLVTTFPAIAERYRRSNPFWLIDEFQDTNNAQYKLIQALAGKEFRNLFVVADDDQIIYEWNGASFRQIQSFLSDFAADLIQLPTNYRCPPAIVDVANRLVAYNAQRTSDKKPLVAGKTTPKFTRPEQLQVRVFPTEEEEALGVAREIGDRGKAYWGQTAILARNRFLLDRVLDALHKLKIPSAIAQRRDDFLSPQVRWLAACLKQVARPLDRRNLGVLVEAFNRITGLSVAADLVSIDAETTQRGYLVTWLEAVRGEHMSAAQAQLLDSIVPLVSEPSAFKTVVDAILEIFSIQTSDPNAQADLAEDLAAWRELSRDIARQVGRDVPLDQFLQELQLRSKESSPKPDMVRLLTIHGAKGKEFEIVYLIGLAEDVIPSYQSRQKGGQSREMEEERRNCFVAITRAKECLVLTRAERYRGWPKEPSRFLVEMGLET